MPSYQITARLDLRAPGSLYSVLDRLSRLFMSFSDEALEMVKGAVRHGFAQNFAAESAGHYRWPELAQRTQEERAAAGWDPRHPILVRSGGYKRSWVQAGHALHFSRSHASGATLTIEEGSMDPRVDTLSGGDWMHNIPERPVEEFGSEGLQTIDIWVGYAIERTQHTIPFGTDYGA